MPALLAVLVTCAGQSLAAGASPGIEIAAPESGSSARIGDLLQVLVVVSPELEVSTVVVMCDARGIGMVQSAPYAVQWNTGGEEPGDHVLRATAYLKSGEKVGAEPVTVSLFRPQGLAAQLAPGATGAAVIRPLTLKEGAPVLLQTTEKMVSGRVAEGTTVRYRVERDIVGPNGTILIAYGSFAQGKVTRSRRRGAFGKAGQLEFTVETVEGVDGTIVPLRAQQAMAGKSHQGTVIATALLLSVFTVFIHGRDIEVPANTEFTAYVDHDTVIQQPQPAPEGGGVRGEPVETVTIAAPADGSAARVGASVSVTASVTPEQKFRSLALLVNGKQVAEQKEKLAPISWSTKGLSPGDYVLEVDVTFTNQRTVRSAPVKVRLTGD